MQITIPLFSEISLKFATNSISSKSYPTSRLQKGFLLIRQGQDLSEEGVGFGVPVLKRGLQTIFPGSAELISASDSSNPVLIVNFKMNLEEKMRRSGGASVKNGLLYAIKNILAALIRRLPPLRSLLTAASNAVRRVFGWETIFQEANFCTHVKMIYTIDRQAGVLTIAMDQANLGGDGITEVIVMNEQGARFFDQYRDLDGTNLQGDEIGCWDPANCDWAAFSSKTHPLAFILQRVQGATVFRGRELIGSRLAWSGFGCSFPPSNAGISYRIKIERAS